MTRLYIKGSGKCWCSSLQSWTTNHHDVWNDDLRDLIRHITTGRHCGKLARLELVYACPPRCFKDSLGAAKGSKIHIDEKIHDGSLKPPILVTGGRDSFTRSL